MVELNKIYNEDCLIGMSKIPDGSIDMILCDLPFGSLEIAWDKRIPFKPLWEQYKRIIKENAAIVLFSQMPFGAELIMSNPKMFRYEIIVEKKRCTGFLNAKKMPLRSHENILVFYKKLPTYNPQWTQGKAYKTIQHRCGKGYGWRRCRENYYTVLNDGRRYPRDVIKFNFPHGQHITQKPVDLLEYLIKTYTNEGETVLDNCIGSGSTAVACIETNRNFLGFETDKNYFNIANKRIEAALADKEMRLFA